MKPKIINNINKMNNKKLQKKYESVVGEITKKLTEEYKPERIILYGSVANGQPHEDSDIDMLIIKNVNTHSYTERWTEVRQLTRDLSMGISFEPIILTSKELEKSIKDENLFIMDILEFGTILFAKLCGQHPPGHL